MGTTRYDKDEFKYYTYNKDIQGSTTSVVGQEGTSPVAYENSKMDSCKSSKIFFRQSSNIFCKEIALQ
ncbi:hypothetical protein [Terrisporobacter mayombei]|uniref:hypothetical protein n=1 Tax=Terrisporobacter mayombei TaxID=1541 RepID=UPI001D15E45C|nr:hypothetical protein [Terrisporobacter mayombei]MCC3866624.1 hypothetical protein [Terrisporobacter mayombei]